MSQALDPLVSRPAPPPAGLAGSDGLEDVEALMLRLCVGPRLDRLGVLAQEHLGTGGRRTRARVALAAAEAMGLPRVAVFGWAAACELLHNATLVHDDVQDGDRMRRGAATTWARHGLAQAINVGDLLIVLSTSAIEHVQVDNGVRWALARLLAQAAADTARGQARELELLPQGKLAWNDWQQAALGKSGALLGLPVHGAALAAGVGERSARRLGDAFAVFGALYQAHDDVLDLYGHKGREAPGNDLREGKVSALVVEHLRLHPSDEIDLVTTLSTPRDQTRDAAVAAWICRFRDGGALAAVHQRIRDLESRVLDDATLRAVPDLHAVAHTLVQSLRANAPKEA